MGIPLFADGYECNYDDEPCVCPYDSSKPQTFETFQDYKDHMSRVHQSEPFHKRRVKQLCSEYVIQKRREVAKQQHQEGKFRNTHVKREVLLQFIEIYDDFLTYVFREGYFDDSSLKSKWNDHLRITRRDLENNSLEEIVSELESNYLNRTRRLILSHRALGWDL